MKSAVKKITSIIAAALIMPMSLTGMFTVRASAEEEVAQTADTAETTEDNSYAAYMEKYQSISSATQTISLPIEDAVLSDGSSLETYTQKDSLMLEKNSAASWTIQVPKTAMYTVKFDYCAGQGDQAIIIGFKVDGAVLFDGAQNIELKRIWQDDGEMRKDANNNEQPAKQKQVYEWKTTYLEDYNDYYNGEYTVYLEEGQHTFTLNGVKESAALTNLSLQGQETLPSYADVKAAYEKKGYKKYDGEILKFQAESTYEKSDSSLVSTSDRNSAATESTDGSLNDPIVTHRNTFGNDIWEQPGEWVSYKVDVPEDGLYKLAIKNIQNFSIGMSVMRDIYVDGQIPFKEMKSVVFPYSVNWSTMTISDSNGDPCYIYLTKGTHEVKFVVNLSSWSDVLTKLDQANTTVNKLYREITKITSASPDPNRDYKLENQIPDLIETLTSESENMSELVSEFTKLNNGNSAQTATIKNIANQLDDFAKDPDTIPTRLSKLNTNLSVLSEWLQETKKQPLQMDYFVLAGDNAKLPSATPNFLQSLKFGFSTFFASFVKDYNSISKATSDSITVWYAGSRDQAVILQDMIADGFTGKTGINVNLQLVYSGYNEATLAGKGPDVYLDCNRGTPVNYASRGVLLDISHFDTYNEVMSRFTSDSAVPYTYNGGVYAIPSSQYFFMMFYRTDILKELGVNPPNTWDDLSTLIPILERNHYQIGLPYQTITGQGTEFIGIGYKDIFTTLLLQNGGKLYKNNDTYSNLDSEEAIDTFKTWTDYYTKYGFPLEFNQATRLRTGQIPIMICVYNMYNTFYAAAPEIRGLWTMAPIPGTVKDDGTIDRSVAGSGTACCIFKKAKNPEACWKFLDWYTSNDVQYNYWTQVENQMGPEARSTTANIYAFDRMPWTDSEVANLEEQRKSLVEIPEIPGTYMVTRSIDNAFRSVEYNGSNARTEFKEANNIINDEMKRKRIEFGLE